MDIPSRVRFDKILESIIAELPVSIHTIIEEVPLVVDDEPTVEFAISLLKEWGESTEASSVTELRETLCGLHSGPMMTERSIELPIEMPESVVLYRAGIYEAAGGGAATDDALEEQIRITLLHEIGHHFGMEEDDLERLGYG